jgi:alpha-ketoglutarate-dependent taurine dioxygenase
MGDEMNIDNIKALRLPSICVFKLNDYDKIDEGSIKQILDRHGIVLINVENFKEFDLSKFIIKIGIPHGHDQTSKIVWDIKPGGTTGSEYLARSHGTEEFTFHTDCSYEVNPPAYFALYIIEHDTKGGGHNLFVRNEAIIDELSEESFNILTNTKFIVKVPPEFYKGKETEEIYLLDRNFNLQYRQDIIIRDMLTNEQDRALEEFERIVFNPLNMRKVFVEKNNVVIIDNKALLHARTEIKDTKRHLQRIRFNYKKV